MEVGHDHTPLHTDHHHTPSNVSPTPESGVSDAPEMDHMNHMNMMEHQQHMSHQSHNMHQGMMMYFHGGYNETILFAGWTISNIEGLIGSMIGIFFMGILYEGLKFYREYHMRQSYSMVPFSDVPSGNPSVSSEAPETNITTAPRGRREVIRILQTEILSCHHFFQTFLHLVQLVLSYFLMLIFMTFNSWLCGAVSLGLTAGYFIFGWKKPVVTFGEHCH